MTPRSFGTALASLLQTRSQTLTFNGVVLNASTDDGYCLVRLDQGGVRHVLVPKGASVEYGSPVVVTRQAGQSQLTLVTSGSMTTVNQNISNTTQASGGSVDADVFTGEFLLLDATNGPLTGPLASNSTISATQLISTVPDGTPPLAVSSETNVEHLNSDLLDGYHAVTILSRAWFGI